MLLQKSRSASPHVEGCCITVVHGWTGFYSATSLTFRQTRYQALYTDIQRLIADTASILCRVQRMPSMASAEHEFACRKLTALTGGQWFTAVSSYVNLQHPCCKLTCEFCKSKTSFLPNTPAIRGGSEQNSKQPNVHGCTFDCDGIRVRSELAFLSIKTDNKCSEPYDDFSLIHLENPIRQNLS